MPYPEGRSLAELEGSRALRRFKRSGLCLPDASANQSWCLLNIVFLVTSAPGKMCGVADYTSRLAIALGDIGAEVSVEYLDHWSLSQILKIRRRYRNSPQTIFHLQYPSLNIGNSISPGFLPLLLPNTFVTLHEFRLFHFLRKMMFVLPSLMSKKIIFSNDEERALFRRYFPVSSERLRVIPIGNNIARTSQRKQSAETERVVYFGQISHNKGIEFFIETIAQLREKAIPVEAEMIGALVESDVKFVDFVKRSADQYKIRLRLNLPPQEVSEALSLATIALLPFPDGVTNKRGSALACLDHGVNVLTTHTPLTPEWLSVVTHPVTAPEDAAVLITKITSGEAPRLKAPDILTRELRARDWHAIAREHLRLYEEALAVPGSANAP